MNSYLRNAVLFDSLLEFQQVAHSRFFPGLPAEECGGRNFSLTAGGFDGQPFAVHHGFQIGNMRLVPVWHKCDHRTFICGGQSFFLNGGSRSATDVLTGIIN